jgi:hypothetical protein
MPVSSEPSTFEYARDWLVSSETFVRDAMLADLPGLDESRDQARLRIHREEAIDEPDEEQAAEAGVLPAIDSRPRAWIRTIENRRRKVGTGTFAGSGRLAINVEVIVPEEYRVNEADDDSETKAEKIRGRKEWARRLCDTIKAELHYTSGLGDADGTPYLNGTIESEDIIPSEPEVGAVDWMGWVWNVDWN